MIRTIHASTHTALAAVVSLAAYGFLTPGAAGAAPVLHPLVQSHPNAGTSAFGKRLPSLLPARTERRLNLFHHQVREQRLTRAAKPSSYVYTCNYYGSDCTVFSSTGKRIGGLSASDGLVAPVGTTTDSQGNWYIANTGASNILVFSPGGVALEGPMDDPSQYPIDVAWGPSNTLAVSNYSDTSGGMGSVSVYAYGATSPTAMLSDPNAYQGGGIAFDSAGNCYWSYNGPSGGGIDEFVGCSGPPVNLGIALGIAGGLALSTQSNLYFNDQHLPGTILCVYPGPPCDPLPVPFADPIAFHFDSSGTNGFVADAVAGSASEFSLSSYQVSRKFVTAGGDPPFGVTPGIGIDLLPPDTVGQEHAVVMQALVQNFAAIEAILGPSNPDPTGVQVLEAMLQVPAVPDNVKAIIRQALSTPTPPQPTGACADALAQFTAGYPQTGSFSVLMRYLNGQLGIQTSCMEFHEAVQDAVAIAQQGRSTIYNPKWYKQFGSSSSDSRRMHHNWKHVKWGEVAGADIGGALGGLKGGAQGALVGALAGSAGDLIGQLLS